MLIVTIPQTFSINRIRPQPAAPYPLRAQMMLTPREFDVVKLVISGYNMNQIGQILSISCRTAQTHWENTRQKLDIGPKERWKIFWWATEMGLIKYTFLE